jgi:hypothetical protein
MTEPELREARTHKWRLDGRGAHTLEDARAFVEAAGMCLVYAPERPVLLPTFCGAYFGHAEKLPTARQAFADARAQEAVALMVRLLRERAAYEASVFGETGFLVSSAVFPYVYALIGDRNPRQAPKLSGAEAVSQLACDVFTAIEQHGAMAKPRLKERLGGDLSGAAIDRALSELWARLRITRVDYKPEEGALWDVLFRWSPDAVQEGLNVSVGEALSALVSKYLECVVAAEPKEVEEFFAVMAARSRVRESVNALLAARELSFIVVGHRSMVQITPPKPAPQQRYPQRRPKAGNRA